MKLLCLTPLLIISFSLNAISRSAVESVSSHTQHSNLGLRDKIVKAQDQPPVKNQSGGAESCVDGMAGIYECLNIDLLAHLNPSQIGASQVSDSWGWKDEATGRYFALVGHSNGTSFIEVTDPNNPIYLGVLPSTNFSTSVFRDVKTYQNHAFIVAGNIENHGMQVFDLSRLLTVNSVPVTFTVDKLYTGNNFEEAHNIVINEQSGFAYLVAGNTCSAGMHMVDIQDPLNPVFAGCFLDSSITHDAQCVIYTGPDTEHQDKEICFTSNENKILVIDVSNKNAPVVLSSNTYQGQAYTHQGWLTEDQKYFVFGDELDELARGGGVPDTTRTYVMDMTDLDNPVFKGFHDAGEAGIDHNQYIVDGYLYQANYNRGLRILKLEDLSQAQMLEVAYFDTYPAALNLKNTTPDLNPADFDGAWNVYPFFDNGTILVSDISRGLFIVKANIASAIDIGNFHTGLWYNREQSGHGLNIEILNGNRIVAVWYTYDNDGNQMWLLGVGNYEGSVATLNVIVTENGLFPPNFLAEDVVNTDWGTFQLDFTGCNSVELSWAPFVDVNFTAGSLSLTRLTNIAGLSCEPQ
ncbi:MAG: choice-of-anchor B family protein [Proteobacteria bacterium]|nr:choice-of-anchor B family protein [Pseudomonadota bacterium]